MVTPWRRHRRAPTPNPRPPTAAEAARIVNEAWRDPDWGTLVWVAMTTGARRGELCALRWSHVDLDPTVRCSGCAERSATPRTAPISRAQFADAAV
jgi:integrase